MTVERTQNVPRSPKVAKALLSRSLPTKRLLADPDLAISSCRSAVLALSSSARGSQVACLRDRVIAQHRKAHSSSLPLTNCSLSILLRLLLPTMVLLPPPQQIPSSLLSSLPSTAHYLIFFSTPSERGRPFVPPPPPSSIAKGDRRWCRDCRAAEAPIANSIGEAESTIVYVGDRET